MSLEETMTEHMNAIRSITALDQKLTLKDATSALAGVKNAAIHEEKVYLTDSMFDPNTWYPVQAPSGYHVYGFDRIKVAREIDGLGGAPWGNHVTSSHHGFTVWKEIMLNHSGWGALQATAYRLANIHRFDDGKNPVHIDEAIDNGGYVLWLRGGAYYNVFSDNAKLSWQIRADGIKTDDQVFMPTKTEPEDFGTLKSVNLAAGVLAINFIDLTTLKKPLEKLGGGN